MRPDREKALDMWAARKPDGSFSYPDADMIAWECGYANGVTLATIVCRLRKANEPRAVKRHALSGPRKKWPRVVELRAQKLTNAIIGERIGSSEDSVATMFCRAKKQARGTT